MYIQILNVQEKYERRFVCPHEITSNEGNSNQPLTIKINI